MSTETPEEEDREMAEFEEWDAKYVNAFVMSAELCRACCKAAVFVKAGEMENLATQVDKIAQITHTLGIELSECREHSVNWRYDDGYTIGDDFDPIDLLSDTELKQSYDYIMESQDKSQIRDGVFRKFLKLYASSALVNHYMNLLDFKGANTAFRLQRMTLCLEQITGEIEKLNV